MTENNRTHEPSLREVTAEIDGMRTLMDERDRRYSDAFIAQKEAVAAALAAQQLAAGIINTASEKAINKAEEAQRAYNERSNEFRGALDDAQKVLLPRNEADTRFQALEEKLNDARKDIQTLREFRSIVVERKESQIDERGQANWATSNVAAYLAAGVALALLVLKAFGR